MLNKRKEARIGGSMEIEVLSQVVKKFDDNHSAASRYIHEKYKVLVPSGRIERYMKHPESINEDKRQRAYDNGLDLTK